ncbi:hypothetical protein MKY98_07945 [Paenibacillus sp. FSL M8-0228]|uniref:hypothetical protein n=1 Tax=Paenibacillus sp. FSL M8-0228 TaxID=2921620 RepID=UPI0030FC0642
MENVFEPLLAVAANQSVQNVESSEGETYSRIGELLDELQSDDPKMSRYALELESIVNYLVGSAAEDGVKKGFELCLELKKQLS